nr:AAA family ATPase [Sphaerisporangium album]
MAEPGPAVALAGLGVIGSVGGNVLSDVISAALTAARTGTRSGTRSEPEDPARPTERSADAAVDGDRAAERAAGVARLERALAAGVEEVLNAGDARAEALAETLALVLSQVEAATVVVSEAIALGDARLLEKLGSGFAALGRQMTVFAPLLGRLDGAVVQVQQTLYRQDAEHRFDRSQTQRQISLLLGMREQLTDLTGRLPGDLSGQGAVPGVGPGAGGVWAGGCPYQGLAPFGPAQAGVFYGRGQQVARLMAMVTATSGGGLIVVTGASGAGKSSLLHAGLLPALAAPPPAPVASPGVPRGDGRAGGAAWAQVTFTPGKRPLQELAVQLAVRCGADPDAVLGELRENPGRAAARARQVLAAEQIRHPHGASGGGPQRLIMIVDQFEELFTLASAEYADEAEMFIAALDAISTATGPAGAAVPGSPGGRAAGGGRSRGGGGARGLRRPLCHPPGAGDGAAGTRVRAGPDERAGNAAGHHRTRRSRRAGHRGRLGRAGGARTRRPSTPPRARSPGRKRMGRAGGVGTGGSVAAAVDGDGPYLGQPRKRTADPARLRPRRRCRLRRQRRRRGRLRIPESPPAADRRTRHPGFDDHRSRRADHPTPCQPRGTGQPQPAPAPRAIYAV